MSSKREMISIWFWVGLMLGIYGLIILGMGIHYAIEPETATATAAYNPSLWWGAVMTVFGVVFLALGRFGRTQVASD